MPAPPNIDAAVELGVPKVDAVVELPPKTFLLALAAFGAAPRPLKKPPPLLPVPDEPKTLVVEAAPEVAAPEVVPDEPNTLAVEAAVEVAVVVAALVELAPNKGFCPPKTDEVCAAPPKVEAAAAAEVVDVEKAVGAVED